MDEYYHAAESLPSWLARPLMQLPVEMAQQVHEIRMRTGCELRLTLEGKQCPIGELSSCPQGLRHLSLTQLQMEEIFYTLCGGSVHTYQTELAEGYLTLPGGHRVGVGGKYLAHPEQGVVLQTVWSLNLRIARAKTPQLPAQLCQALQGHFTGLLVIGEPDSGKTTLLRGVARYLAGQNASVAVIDEREELWPEGCRTNRQNGGLPLDVLAGLPKERALQMALRTLSPRAILLDELGGMEEVYALERGFFSGVDFAASLHASSLEDAARRPQIAYMKEHGMLRVLVLLEGRQAPGVIKEVCFV